VAFIFAMLYVVAIGAVKFGGLFCNHFNNKVQKSMITCTLCIFNVHRLSQLRAAIRKQILLASKVVTHPLILVIFPDLSENRDAT
jgi:hypothetical protein